MDSPDRELRSWKRNLTNRFCASVKPCAERVDYFDTNTRGLMFRVAAKPKDPNARARKVWRVSYRLNGEWHRLQIGEYPQMSLKDARAEAAEKFGDVAKGIDPAEEKQARKESGTFSDLAADYMLVAEKKKKSAAEDRRILYGSAYAKNVSNGRKKFVGLVDRWGSRKVLDLKRKHVQSLLDEIAFGNEDEGRAPAPIMANRVLALVRRMLNWALKEEWEPLLEANVAARITNPGAKVERDRVLSNEEIRAVWAEAEKERSAVTAVIKLLLLTAQRGGEVRGMEWDELDLETRWWTIRKERSKNGRAHRVWLSDTAIAIVKSLKAAADADAEANDREVSAYVFPARGKDKKKPIDHIQKAIERTRTRCGFDFTAHDLRRTAASGMTGMNIPVTTVAKILNHTEAKVTRIYDRHSYDQQKAQALAAWDLKLHEILTETTDSKVVPFARA